MCNYSKNQFIKQYSEELIRSSMQVQNKLDHYLSKLKVLNTKTGELISLRNDFKQTSRDNYLWLVFQSIYMQNAMIKEKKTALFITLTLPSSYHPFRKSGSKNKSYDPMLKGGRLLTEAFRSIINDFKVSRVRSRLHFQKVIEPHKTLVPHLHALIYVDTDKVDYLKDHIKRQIKNFGLGNQYDIEVIKDIKRSATYLLKYIKKNLSGECIRTTHLIDGWKRDNKIRIYTYSNMSIPKYIFQKISRVVKEKIIEGENVLEVIENLCNITVSTNDGGNISIKNYIGKSIKYEVEIFKTVKKSFVYTPLILDLYQEALLRNDFSKILDFDDCMKTDFFLFVHEVEDFDFDIVFFDPHKFDYDVYFNLYTTKELFGLFENYMDVLHKKIEKIYVLDEFVIKEGSKVLYRKSDFVLY